MHIRFNFSKGSQRQAWHRANRQDSHFRDTRRTAAAPARHAQPAAGAGVCPRGPAGQHRVPIGEVRLELREHCRIRTVCCCC